MQTFQSYEDFTAALEMAYTTENDALFVQARVLAEAVDSGFERRAVYGTFSQLTRLQKRTAYRREKVHRMIGHLRNPELSFEIHALCCDAAILDAPQTWSIARKWLDIASGEDSQGRPFTTRTLREAMKAAGNDPEKEKPRYLIDKDAAIITRLDYLKDEITLRFGEQIPLLTLPENAEGLKVIVTIVQALTHSKAITS